MRYVKYFNYIKIMFMDYKGKIMIKLFTMGVVPNTKLRIDLMSKH